VNLKHTFIAISILLLLFVSPYLNPIQAADPGSVEILNPSVQPSTIRVGDNFTINATILNNSTNTITVKNGCGGPFSVLFDTHAKVEVKKVCNWMAIQIILKPGENITGSSLASNLSYRAVSPGIANATLEISYTSSNQTGNNTTFVGEPVTVSKSFQFTISNQTGTTVFPAFYGKGIIVPNNVFAGTVIWTSIHDSKGLAIVQTPAGRSITHFTVSLSNACASSTICYFATVTDTSSQAFKVGDTARFSVDPENNQEKVSLLTGFLAGVDVEVNLSKIRTVG